MKRRDLLKRKSMLAICMAFALIMGGCGSASSDAPGAENGSGTGDKVTQGAESAENSNNSGDEATVEVAPIDPDEMFSDRDFETDYEESESVSITLTGSSAQCSAGGVEIDGSIVTIRDEGTYILSGSLDDGMVIVDGDKEEKIQLVLDGVNIHSKTCAPLYIKQSDKVFITLAKDSKNRLSNGGSFEAIDDNEIDAVIFSKEDMTINGEGALAISSPGGHGVVSKDELTVTGGAFDITCGSHALSGKDGIGIADGAFQLVSGKDGIHAENNDDASLGYVYIQGGTFNIEAEDDGINAAGAMQIDGGSFHVNAVGDAVHSNAFITVNDGTFAIATEDDGFHADDTLTIAGGIIDISTSYEGLEALHVEVIGGEISLVASDDGLNAAGGMDSSGFGGKGGNDMFGGRGGGRFGGKGGMQGVAPGEKPDMQGVEPEEKPDMKGGTPAGMPGSSSSSGSVVISGGSLYVKASGDGIDANGTLTISGGYTVVCGPTHGDTATLDYDKTAVITGGTFIGTGAMGMAQTFSDSEQGVISVNAGNATAGTTISLADKSNNTLITYTPELDFSVIILSSPEIISGEVYTLTIGTTSAEFTAE